MRIVSLVPSLTSTLCHVGLRDQIVGCTPFCVVPPDLHRTTENVRGPKDPDLEKIAALQPTHIIVNQEENKPEHIEVCQTIAPTVITFPKGPQDVVPMLTDMGRELGAKEPFAGLIADIQNGLQTIKRNNSVNTTAAPRTYVYMIWKNPYMVAGQDTYITHCLDLIGWKNAIPEACGRYPEVTLEQIHILDPHAILLATEPFPFRKRDALALQQEWQPTTSPEIYKVDGRLTQWYGDFTAKFLSNVPEIIQPFAIHQE